MSNEIYSLVKIQGLKTLSFDDKLWKVEEGIEGSLLFPLLHSLKINLQNSCFHFRYFRQKPFFNEFSVFGNQIQSHFN
jgi:hypothetical protein